MPFFGKICLDLDFQFPLEACFRCKKRFFGILIQYFFHKILECSRYVFFVFNIRSCSVPKSCKILFFLRFHFNLFLKKKSTMALSSLNFAFCQNLMVLYNSNFFFRTTRNNFTKKLVQKSLYSNLNSVIQLYYSFCWRDKQAQKMGCKTHTRQFSLIFKIRAQLQRLAHTLLTQFIS